MDKNYTPRIELTAEQKALKEKMLREVGSTAYKAVSFRLTGTLTLTPFSEYGDMFMLMEDEFRDLTTVKGSFTELRIAAGDAAEKKYASEGGATLAKIYDILAKTAKLSSSSCEKLMKRECELAIYFSFPRRFGKELFDKAKATGKKTVILADTVYPRNVIVRILGECGFESCDELVIPSELSLNTSDNRSIYEAVLKKSGAAAPKLLHIGGDVEADVETPIMNGSKALLLSGTVPLMVRSGRLRGFVQAKQVYDYDSPDFLVLHCIFGIYAAYLFDTPINKLPQSDFCGDEYMLGFITGGAALIKSGFAPEKGVGTAVMKALGESARAREGMEDMEKLFHSHFDGHLTKFGDKGCELPFDFLVSHSAIGDRAMMQKYFEPADFAEWTGSSEEPDTAPVYGRKLKRSAASKLADRLFPPGTKVRNIADGLLVKMKGKGRL